MTNLALQSSTSPTGMTCAVKTSECKLDGRDMHRWSLASTGCFRDARRGDDRHLHEHPICRGRHLRRGQGQRRRCPRLRRDCRPVSPPPAGSAAATLPPSNEGASISCNPADAFLEVSATTKPRACTSGTCDLVVTAQNENNVPLQGDVRLTITTTTSSNGTAAPPGSISSFLPIRPRGRAPLAPITPSRAKALSWQFRPRAARI